MESRLKWDRRFMGLAKFVATWSRDPSTKVGSCITRGKRIVSLGFNGFPANTSDDAGIYLDRERKLRRVIHSERNAMSFAKCDLTGCTIYVTHYPCAQCAAQIVQEGITRVVCPQPAAAYAERWAVDIQESTALFQEAQVEVAFLEDEYAET